VGRDERGECRIGDVVVDLNRPAAIRLQLAGGTESWS
jgi:hypothetical protein